METISSMNEGMENLKEIEALKKEIALVREDAQVEIIRRDQRISELQKLDKEHQDLNGKLRLEITRIKGGLWLSKKVSKDR